LATFTIAMDPTATRYERTSGQGAWLMNEAGVVQLAAFEQRAASEEIS
jgi:hypothetical protein